MKIGLMTTVLSTVPLGIILSFTASLHPYIGLWFELCVCELQHN